MVYKRPKHQFGGSAPGGVCVYKRLRDVYKRSQRAVRAQKARADDERALPHEDESAQDGRGGLLFSP